MQSLLFFLSDYDFLFCIVDVDAWFCGLGHLDALHVEPESRSGFRFALRHRLADSSIGIDEGAQADCRGKSAGHGLPVGEAVFRCSFC